MSYADWIRSLPCCCCQDDVSVVQHHLIDIEGVTKGMSTKLPDILSIPLCTWHHDKLHEDMPEWEIIWGSQLKYLARTLVFARQEGITDYE